MRSTESQELFMIYLESHQQLSSGNKLLGGRPSVDHALANLVLMRITCFSSLIKLNGLMYHNTYVTIKDIQEKTLKYGLLGKTSRAKGKNKYLSASWAFIRTFILKAGFLDGPTGIKIATMNTKTTFIKYS